MPINDNAILTQFDTPNDIKSIRAHIIAHNQTLPLQQDSWWFIGSEDCHLCDDTKNDLRVVQRVCTTPHIQYIDVLDLDTKNARIFAPIIPVLITQNAIAQYPFGVLDMIALI